MLIDELYLQEWTCDACNKKIFAGTVENGLELVGFAGSYAGFTDSCFDEKGTFSDKARFCHACCMKLFKLFPVLAKNMGILKGQGHHPGPSDKPCCDYSWSTLSNDEDKTILLISARDKNNILYWKKAFYE